MFLSRFAVQQIREEVTAAVQSMLLPPDLYFADRKSYLQKISADFLFLFLTPLLQYCIQDILFYTFSNKIPASIKRCLLWLKTTQAKLLFLCIQFESETSYSHMHKESNIYCPKIPLFFSPLADFSDYFPFFRLVTPCWVVFSEYEVQAALEKQSKGRSAWGLVQLIPPDKHFTSQLHHLVFSRISAMLEWLHCMASSLAAIEATCGT